MVRAEATAQYVRTSAQKAGLVLDLIRGKNVNMALSALQFSRKAVARDVAQHTRKVFLHFPAQVTREQHDFGGEACVAFDVDRAQRLLLAARERRHEIGLDRHAQGSLAVGRFHGSP